MWSQPHHPWKHSFAAMGEGGWRCFFVTSSEDLGDAFRSTDSSECIKAPQLLHLHHVLSAL